MTNTIHHGLTELKKEARIGGIGRNDYVQQRIAANFAK
jgi:hypothetical protein